ncbi:hypothetical protein HD554DRAFT_1173619 [Boletus coccyginus]|nr:hypothetical protein HD554DRAFT_1173619 [Boletus coccyginus]
MKLDHIQHERNPLERLVSVLLPSLINTYRSVRHPSKKNEERAAEATVTESSRRALNGGIAFCRRCTWRDKTPSTSSASPPSRSGGRSCTTPRTVREILPELTATRTTAELCRKFGEKIVGEIIPVLQHTVVSPVARTRQGVYLMLSDIICLTGRARPIHSARATRRRLLTLSRPRSSMTMRLSGRQRQKRLTHCRSISEPRPSIRRYLRYWKPSVNLARALGWPSRPFGRVILPRGERGQRLRFLMCIYAMFGRRRCSPC